MAITRVVFCTSREWPLLCSLKPERSEPVQILHYNQLVEQPEDNNIIILFGALHTYIIYKGGTVLISVV